MGGAELFCFISRTPKKLDPQIEGVGHSGPVFTVRVRPRGEACYPWEQRPRVRGSSNLQALIGQVVHVDPSRPPAQGKAGERGNEDVTVLQTRTVLSRLVMPNEVSGERSWSLSQKDHRCI